MFNMILKDGTKSDNLMTIRSTVKQRYDYFLPQNKEITAVAIYYRGFVFGFRFFLSDGSWWDIGRVDDYETTEIVEITEKEVIVGFKAKSHPDCQTWYVEFQFITA